MNASEAKALKLHEWLCSPSAKTSSAWVNSHEETGTIATDENAGKTHRKCALSWKLAFEASWSVLEEGEEDKELAVDQAFDGRLWHVLGPTRKGPNSEGFLEHARVSIPQHLLRCFRPLDDFTSP